MSGSVPLAGVIGWPIAHSRSPRIHGFWLNQLGLPGHYVPLSVRPGDLDEVLRALPKAGFRGVNVTLPHKEEALALADSATDVARAIGAANTLTFTEGRIHADNTDAHGFAANLHDKAPDWTADSGPALVLGAGGAARAILFALLKEGAPRILLANRTASRAQELADEFGDRIAALPWAEISEATKSASTIVNTTSLGMAGQPPLDIELNGDQPKLVTDIVYSPLETPLLEQARRKNMVVVDGLGMLLHQAVPGFTRWFGQPAAVTDELRRVVLA